MRLGANPDKMNRYLLSLKSIIMTVQELGTKRKRSTNGVLPSRKRKLISEDSQSLDFEAVEQRISDDPTKNRPDAERLFALLDTNEPRSKLNLEVGLSVCKVYMRLVGNGKLVALKRTNESGAGSHDWYLGKLDEYRQSMVELSKKVPASMRLQYHHLCWKILTQDAEFLGADIWTSNSIFKPFVLSMTESLEEKNVEQSFIVERLNEWHDFCFHSLEFLTYAIVFIL